MTASAAGYDRYLALIRGIRAELECFEDVEALVDAYDGGLGIALGAAERATLPTAGLDVDLAAGAAFCLRYREVLALTRQRDIRRRLEQAREEGEGWVDLERKNPWLELPFPPWSALEMHLPEGTGLHSWVEESPDGTGDGFVYGIEVVQLDPQTGSWLQARPPGGRQTFLDYRSWQDALDLLKARYEQPHPFDTERKMGG